MKSGMRRETGVFILVSRLITNYSDRMTVDEVWGGGGENITGDCSNEEGLPV